MKFNLLKILVAIVLILATSTASFSQNQNSQILPVDSLVKTGKLSNGLAYYIRKNSKPEDRIEMRLVVKAGSVLEDSIQQGLAHFVEHMCFNGTKHFPKNKLVEYLQSVGVQFGPDINAYTSFDETVYMLTLPADSPKIVDNGYLVMEDWAHNVTFDTSEINKERGVILEEWRLGRGAFQRMRDKNLPVLLKGSKYAERLPIGKKDVIEHASYATIKSFYKDWYRPDLMAFIIVGDINPDSVEAKIKQHFEWIKNPEKERKRIEYTIPNQDSTLVTIATDKESPVTVVSIYDKTEAARPETYGAYRNMILHNMFTGMLNERLNELKDLPRPPFINAGSYYGDFLGDKSVFVTTALVSDTGIDKGLQTLLTENERLKLYGFTESEFDRYKKILLNQYERFYKERDKTESSSFADEYIRNFLKDEPIPGITFEYNYVKDNLPDISLAEVNALCDKLIESGNRVIVVNAPAKAGLIIPDKSDLLALVEKVQTSKISPYVDKTAGTHLMAVKPEKGRVLISMKKSDIDAVELKLSNGARVILKPTDFKNDEILFRAESPGGQSLYPLEDKMSAANAAAIENASGLGEYSKTELNKMLAGKTVGLSSWIGLYTEGLSGNAAPKDLETLMQMINLEFTAPRKDDTAFTSYVNKIKAYYKNVLADPTQYFFNKYQQIMTQNNPRANTIPTEKEIDMINLDRAYEIFKESFSDAGNFTFFFVGSFNIDSIKPLLETYIASLPSLRKNETWKDLGIRPPSEKLDEKIYRGEDPKSIVIINFVKEAPWNEKDDFMLSIFGSLLNRKYIEILREQMSEIYGIQTDAGMEKIPYQRAHLKILFPCSPDNIDSLTTAALNEIRKIQNEGVTAEDIEAAKEIQRRAMEVNLRKNSYWIGTLLDIYTNNKSLDILAKYKQMIDEISSDELKKIANQYVNLNDYIRVALHPEQQK